MQKNNQNPNSSDTSNENTKSSNANSKFNNTDYYQILEVDRDAQPTDIHKSYLRAKATYSVENPALYSMFSPDEAREWNRLIEEAYLVLGNQTQRRLYDHALAAGIPFYSPIPNATSPSAAVSHQTPPAPQQGQKQKHAHIDTSPPTPATSGANQTDSSWGLNEKNYSEDKYFVRPLPTHQRVVTPEGMGRTNFGFYKLDPTLESEIQEKQDWDGLFLQRVRSYKNITLDQMSDATRIGRSYLTALESNQYQNLPAAVFVRGFVIQIARILGLNESQIAASFMKDFKAKGGK